jgi:O-antigen/teichoic acid export membrane protein
MTTVFSARIMHVLRTLLRFSVGQIAAQIATAVTGLFLVRWLSISGYAEFGFSLTFQSTLGLIVDLGVTAAIIALVGDQYSNRAVLGQYMHAGLALRTRLLAAASLIGAIAFVYLASRQGWPPAKQASVFAIVLFGLVAQFWSSLYGVPLILNQKLGTYYGVQVGAAALRLSCIAGLHRLQLLDSFTALLSGGLASLAIALVFKRLASVYWTSGLDVDAGAMRDVLRYIAPLAPGMIFMSIQNQLTVIIVSYFGVVRAIAEVAALSRLGQVFTLLNAFNAVILGPRFARLDKGRIKRFYVRTALAASGVAVLAGCIPFLWPESLLWLLGPKYANLTESLRLVTSAGCLGYISSVLWSIHSARQWIYWWSTWLFIALITAVQALGIVFLDVNTTIGASKLAFVTALAALLVDMSVGVYSLRRGKGMRSPHSMPLAVIIPMQDSAHAAGPK